VLLSLKQCDNDHAIPELLMSTKILHLLLLAALLVAATVVPAAQDDQPSAGEIWTHGNTVLFFAPMRQCGDEQTYTPMQTLVSRDAGKSWSKSGPRLFGSSFLYVLNVGGETWIAGDNYVEGPAHDPFLLLMDPNNAEWPEFPIYDGPEEFRALAHDERNPNRFVAWIDHVDLYDTDATHIFLHESLDRGRTWRVVKEVKRVPKAMPGLRFFSEPRQESGDWRVSAVTLPRTLEHLGPDGKWHQAAQLPLPIQENCSD
jgi:hypothetical protein